MSDDYDYDNISFDDLTWHAAHNPDFMDLSEDEDGPDLMDSIVDDSDKQDSIQDSDVPDSNDDPDSDANISIPDSFDSAPSPSSSPSPPHNPDHSIDDSPDFAQRQIPYAYAPAHPQEEDSDVLEDSGEEEAVRPREYSSPGSWIPSPPRPPAVGREVVIFESDEEYGHDDNGRQGPHFHGGANDIYFDPLAAIAGPFTSSLDGSDSLDDGDDDNHRPLRPSTSPVQDFDEDLSSVIASSDSNTPSPSRSPSSESESDSGSERPRQRRPIHDPSSVLTYPARASLTPTIHPHRRLPRDPLRPQNRTPPGQNLRRLSDNSDSSSDEPLIFDERPRPRASQHQLPRLPHIEPIPLSDDEDDDEDEEEVVEEVEGFGRPSGSEQSRSSSISPEDLLLLEDSDEEDDSGTEAQREIQEHFQRLQELQDIQGRRARLQAIRVARGRREASLQRGQPARRAPLFVDWDDSDAEIDMDDELVEVVFDRQVNARPNQPQQQPQRRQRPHGHNNNNHQAAEDRDVIDLTAVPDSPVLQHRPVRAPRLDNNQAHDAIQRALHRRARNPRRQMAQNGRMPSFARSDGTNLGNRPDIIDLTSDGPEDDLDIDDDGLQGIPANRRLPAPVPALRNHIPNAGFLAIGRGLISLGANLFAGAQYNQVQVVGGQPLNNMDANFNPLEANLPNFNYQNNGFGGGGRQPTPKPDYVPPPPARPGFTRSTGPDPETGEEMVIVCASCDNELKYSDDKDDDGPRPAKKARTKKDREEHYFWAVKACGHVSYLCDRQHTLCETRVC